MLTDEDLAKLAHLADNPDHSRTEQPTYPDRPDPDEPWRYTCPDCESVTVSRLIGGEKARNKDYPHGRGAQQAAEDRAKLFRCGVCGERKATVYDRKRSAEVRSV